MIVTTLSTLAELALLSFLFVLNNLHECKQLENGNGVRMRNHLRRTRIISVLSLAAFFVLELVFSFYNAPVDRVSWETHPCVKVPNSVREGGASTAFLRAADVLVQCRTLQNGTMIQSEGDFNKQTQQVKCSPPLMFTHPVDDGTINESIPDIPYYCVRGNEGEVCIFMHQGGNLSLLSRPFILEDFKCLPEIFPYLPTVLHFEPPSNLTLFSDRTIGAFNEGIYGPAALKRIIYSGARDGSCTFPVVDGTATTVPLAMLIALSVVWAIAILLFLSVLRLRKKVFFKVNSPMDWETRTIRAMDDPLHKNPILTGIRNEERMLVQVSTSAIES